MQPLKYSVPQYVELDVQIQDESRMPSNFPCGASLECWSRLYTTPLSYIQGLQVGAFNQNASFSNLPQPLTRPLRTVCSFSAKSYQVPKQ